MSWQDELTAVPDVAGPESVDVEIVFTGRYNHKGQYVDIVLNGEVIGTHLDPEYHACRLLAARGVTGTVNFWRRGPLRHVSSLDIERGSKCHTGDGRKHIRVSRYVPYPGRDKIEAQILE